MKRLMTVSTVLGLLVLAAAAGAEVFVYPKQGQGQDQFQKDQFECHNWAQGQTGVNPSQPVQVASAAPQQGRMRQNQANRSAAESAQQAQAQQEANLGRYDQAYGACMGGRGYQVK